MLVLMFPLRLPSGLIVSALIGIAGSAELAFCESSQVLYICWPLSTWCSDVDLNHILWKEMFFVVTFKICLCKTGWGHLSDQQSRAYVPFNGYSRQAQHWNRHCTSVFFFFYEAVMFYCWKLEMVVCILQHSNAFCQLWNSLTTSESVNHFQFFYMNCVFHFLAQSFIFLY